MDRKESDTLCVRVSVLRESLHPDKTEVFQYMKCSLGKVVTDIPDLEIYEKDNQTVIAEKKESDLKQKNREETGSRQLSAEYWLWVLILIIACME